MISFGIQVPREAQRKFGCFREKRKENIDFTFARNAEKMSQREGRATHGGIDLSKSVGEGWPYHFLQKGGWATHGSPELNWRERKGWPYHFLQRKVGDTWDTRAELAGTQELALPFLATGGWETLWMRELSRWVGKGWP